MTADSVVTTLTDADASFANVVSNGHNVCYKSNANGDSGAAHALPGGGSLAPCN